MLVLWHHEKFSGTTKILVSRADFCPTTISALNSWHSTACYACQFFPPSILQHHHVLFIILLAINLLTGSSAILFSSFSNFSFFHSSWINPTWISPAKDSQLYPAILPAFTKMYSIFLTLRWNSKFDTSPQLLIESPFQNYQLFVRPALYFNFALSGFVFIPNGAREDSRVCPRDEGKSGCSTQEGMSSVIPDSTGYQSTVMYTGIYQCGRHLEAMGGETTPMDDNLAKDWTRWALPSRTGLRWRTMQYGVPVETITQGGLWRATWAATSIENWTGWALPSLYSVNHSMQSCVPP